jgi:hypothetical protein
MKTCSKCKIEKSKSEFRKNKSKKDGLDSWCKTCGYAYVKDQRCTPSGKESTKKRTKKYKDTPSGRMTIRKLRRAWTKTPRGKEYIRKFRLRTKYGITLEDYDIILKNQDYVCAICGTNEPGTQGRLCVDHCHNTRKVRGLLCNKCNIGLGAFNDNVKVLAKAIQYLEEGQW